MAKSRYKFLIMINLTPGGDDEMNAFLDNIHVPETLQIEGFVGCTRYELAKEEAGNPKAAHRYMHMYDIETDDLGKVKEALKASAATRTPLSPAMDLSTVFSAFYKERG